MACRIKRLAYPLVIVLVSINFGVHGANVSKPAQVSCTDGGISVRDFNATGDGKTDDTLALQAAIDAARKQQKVPRGPSNGSLSCVYQHAGGSGVRAVS